MAPRRLLLVVSAALSVAWACIPNFEGVPCEPATSTNTCPDDYLCQKSGDAGQCVKSGASGGGTGGGTGGGAGGGSTLACRPCTGAADTSCGATASCLRRLCDGTWACHPAGVDNQGCGRIDGGACPAVVNFGVCTSASQCGPGAKCLRGRCFVMGCTKNDDCVIPDLAGKTVQVGRCVTFGDEPSRCYQGCTSASDTSCPSGTFCESFANGNYGYCEVPTTCQSCAASACPAGAGCYRRLCDGLLGCYPDADPYCSTIGGQPVPQVCNYGPCTSGANQCGSQSSCVTNVGEVNGRCLQSCTTAGECSAPDALWGDHDALCVNFTGVGSRCMPKCTGTSDMTCPTGTSCVGPTSASNYYCDY